MPDLILGPAGVLPPGDWAVGARVSRYGRPSVVVAVYDNSGPLLAFDRGWLTTTREEAATLHRLDLTTGPLDFGTRALLALVAPEVGQPLTAPWWRQHAKGWDLIVPSRGFFKAFDVVGEPDPRRALALALHAAAGARHE